MSLIKLAIFIFLLIAVEFSDIPSFINVSKANPDSAIGFAIFLGKLSNMNLKSSKKSYPLNSLSKLYF
nr:MAG TPA: hypothetical protein [Crassvirales sp.]